jgi:protein SDA1
LAIANNFITERNSSEVIAVGINAVREICAKCPLAMSEDLLGDLVQYRSYKDRAVTTAAKSLISLFREKNSQMLQRKLRGRPTEATVEKGIKQKIYGETDIKSYIPGAEVIKLEDVQRKNDSKYYA